MVCQFASKTLWPSSRLEIPALPLHGRSFRNGVRFSVQTTSLETQYRPCGFGSVDKVETGTEQATETVDQTAPPFFDYSITVRIAFFASVYPRPNLHSSPSFPSPFSWPSAPFRVVPSSYCKSQV
ncbi:hypothetical protein KC337_g89 [Hortaea werneckii]|nr:hypothetical protein KC337_g89 [Hortaea werneckii]